MLMSRDDFFEPFHIYDCELFDRSWFDGRKVKRARDFCNERVSIDDEKGKDLRYTATLTSEKGSMGIIFSSTFAYYQESGN